MLMAQKYIKKILEIIIIILFVIIIILTTLQVVTRYLRMSPFPWTEEISRLLLVWASYLTVSVVIANKAHIKVDFFHNKFPIFLQMINDFLSDIIFLLFSLTIIYFGYIVTDVAMNDLSTSLQYPRALFYMPVPVSGVLNLVFLIPDIYKSFMRIIKPVKE